MSSAALFRDRSIDQVIIPDYWDHDWFTLDIERATMKRINPSWIFTLGAHLYHLQQMIGDHLSRDGTSSMPLLTNLPLIQEMIFSRTELLHLQDKHYSVDLPRCKTLASDICKLITLHIPALPQDPADLERAVATLAPVIEVSMAAMLKDKLLQFSGVLRADLGDAWFLMLEDKGVYSAGKLIEHADAALSPEVRATLPEMALYDLKESGRCLACDCFTASGFHVLRAVESVMRHYIVKAQGELPQDRLDWFGHITAITKCGGTRSVTDLLMSIRKNHRNPLIHAEDKLEETYDAGGLFSMCVTAIDLMITEIKMSGLVSDVCHAPVAP